MESNPSQKIKKNKGASADRVVLGQAEANNLSKWINEFNSKAEGIVKISKSDLVNHLIAHHTQNISSDELQQISARFYDEARWLNWSLAKIKEAQKKGISCQLEDLIHFRDEFIGRQKKNSHKKSKPPQSKASNTEGELPPKTNNI